MSSATPSNASLPNPAFDPTRRPSRLKDVQPRMLLEFGDWRELCATFAGAIGGTSPSPPAPPFQRAIADLAARTAHKRLYEDAGVLHGDVNMHTIVILDHPDGSTEGALVHFDHPVSVAGCRKLTDPDPTVPASLYGRQ